MEGTERGGKERECMRYEHQREIRRKEMLCASQTHKQNAEFKEKGITEGVCKQCSRQGLSPSEGDLVQLPGWLEGS